jgi:Domain of unknown function (DUF4201)
MVEEKRSSLWLWWKRRGVASTKREERHRAEQSLLPAPSLSLLSPSSSPPSLLSLLSCLSLQVLTHTREKLRFYEKSNKVSQVRLTELEEKTLCLRGEVSSCKQLRDATRDEKKELKIRQGFANNELLISDFENRKRDILCTADRIADLQNRHHSLSLLVASFPPAPVAFPSHSSSSSTLRGGSSGNTHTHIDSSRTDMYVTRNAAAQSENDITSTYCLHHVLHFPPFTCTSLLSFPLRLFLSRAVLGYAPPRRGIGQLKQGGGFGR